MRKWKYLLAALLAAALLCGVGCALAADADPIVCSIELDPAKLAAPGTVNVAITIANSGSADMKDPVTLYDPAAQVVADFGTDGSAVLKAGESKTWKGTYDVNQRTLDNGSIVYYAKYTIYKDSGEAVPQSQSIRGAISLLSAEASIAVKRTITPSAAREGQEVVVKYEIQNAGTVSLTDVTIQENKSINSKKQTIPELKAGQTAEIKYPVTMGTKDLTSGATITYMSELSKKKQTYTVENTKIVYGDSSLEVQLASSSKGVPVNDKITLTLTVKNKGTIAVSDVRVTDPALGEVFAGQEVAAGKTLTLTKEITLTEDAEYAFTVTGTDATGTEVTASSDPVKVVTVDPSEVLTLGVTAAADKTEVFESPGMVRFTVEISNQSQVDANKVTVKHGETSLYTFDSIPAGETRTLSRDTALSMAGKYRFTVTAKDPLDNSLTFESNEIQVAFSVPTPAPATETPPPVPTEEPTFSPVTMPPISDASIGATPKTIQSVLLPVLILAGVLLIASGALLVIATKRRAEQRKAAEAALDHLERAKRRDYVTPADEQEAEEEKAEVASVTHREEDDLSDFDLPSLDAVDKAKQELAYPSFSDGLYDEEMTSDLNQYAQTDDAQATQYDQSYDQPIDDAYPVDDAQYESDGYTDGFAQDGSYAQDDGYTDMAYDTSDTDGNVDPYAATDEAPYVDGHAPDDRQFMDEPASDPPESVRGSRRSRVRGSEAPTDL